MLYTFEFQHHLDLARMPLCALHDMTLHYITCYLMALARFSKVIFAPLFFVAPHILAISVNNMESLTLCWIQGSHHEVTLCYSTAWHKHTAGLHYLTLCFVILRYFMFHYIADDCSILHNKHSIESIDHIQLKN